METERCEQKEKQLSDVNAQIEEVDYDAEQTQKLTHVFEYIRDTVSVRRKQLREQIWTT